MKFATTALIFAAVAAAMPHNSGVEDKKIAQVLKQTQDKCGNDLQVKCCNKSSKSGNSVSEAKGVLSGLLPNAGAGSDFGLFGECSDVPISVPVAVLGGSASLNQLLSQKCKQNVACCQNTNSEAHDNLVGVAVPCVSFGSVI